MRSTATGRPTAVPRPGGGERGPRGRGPGAHARDQRRHARAHAQRSGQGVCAAGAVERTGELAVISGQHGLDQDLAAIERVLGGPLFRKLEEKHEQGNDNEDQYRDDD